MHLFLELLTTLFTVLAGVHAFFLGRREGLWLFVSLLLLGFFRENWVAVRHVLYAFAPLHLNAGAAPLIATVIWAFSIYAAILWAWILRSAPSRAPFGIGAGSLLPVASFMAALACFYEPFLSLVGMARWEAGTRVSAGVPWIALIGYPSLAVAFLCLHELIRRVLASRWALRMVAVGVTVPLLAIAHARGLESLKLALRW